MRRLEHQEGEDSLDTSLCRLLSAAFPPQRVESAFRDSLRLELENEARPVMRVSVGRRSSPALDENVSRLFAGLACRDVPGFTASQSIRQSLWREVESRARDRHRPRWFPRLVAIAAPAVILAGFVLYPMLWLQAQTGVELQAAHGQIQVSQSRPLFFNLGSRVSTSTLSQGQSFVVRSGDTVRTGSGSLATLSFFERGTVTLYPGSTLQVVALEDGTDGSIPSARVFLDAGQVRNQLTAVSFELRSPDATTSIVGTVFNVEVVTGVHTWVATDSGSVCVDTDGQSVKVSAGEEVFAVRDQPLVVFPQRPPELIIDSPPSPEVRDSTVLLAGRTRVDADVTVNGGSVPVAVDGSFSTELVLQPGANRVIVVATSPIGRSVTVELVLILEQ
jgi:hypothetical protein